jgi:beta-N-acetylhexosaminidase/D-alanyl-D-alanine dipeptidase
MRTSASLRLVIGWIALLAFDAGAELGGRPGDFVDVAEEVPSIKIELRYATTNNFTGKAIYTSKRCLLRRDVADRLESVQEELEELGLGLKIWDGYRPFSVQKRFWKIFPNDRYVAMPTEWYGRPLDGSKHCRGAAVDVTLIDLKTGKELEMPTQFDDFSKRAHRNNKDCTPTARKNRELLEKMMVDEGFEPMPTEWWHFNVEGWEKYELSDAPVE